VHIVTEAITKHVPAAIVGVVIMDSFKKEKPRDRLENHTIRNSTKEMDGKLNEAKKKLNERY